MEQDILDFEKESLKKINFGDDLGAMLSFEVAYSAIRAGIRQNINRMAEIYPSMDRFVFLKLAEIVTREELIREEYTDI